MITEAMFCEMQKEMILSLYGSCYATPYRVDAAYDMLIAMLQVLKDKDVVLLKTHSYNGIEANGQVLGFIAK